MRLEPKHPLPIRIHHWTNAVALPVMIVSGLMIYWAEGTYKIRLGRWSIDFFPDWFYRPTWRAWGPLWRLDHRLAYGLSWHFTFMWVFGLNGLLFVVYNLYSGEWRFLVPTRRSLGEAWQVVLHDLHIRKEPLPRRKFNDAQRIAYTGVILMGLGSLLTGLAIYRPVQLSWLTWLMGGYELARVWHFALTLGYVGFFVIHISQVIKAGWNNFRSMVIGVEVASDKEPTYESVARS